MPFSIRAVLAGNQANFDANNKAVNLTQLAAFEAEFDGMLNKLVAANTTPGQDEATVNGVALQYALEIAGRASLIETKTCPTCGRSF